MKKEAAVIIGIVIAVLNALVVGLGAGDFDDGIQLEDLIPILAPIAGAFGIRLAVWSQASVDAIAPPATQNEYLRRK